MLLHLLHQGAARQLQPPLLGGDQGGSQVGQGDGLALDVPRAQRNLRGARGGGVGGRAAQGGEDLHGGRGLGFRGMHIMHRLGAQSSMTKAGYLEDGMQVPLPLVGELSVRKHVCAPPISEPIFPQGMHSLYIPNKHNAGMHVVTRRLTLMLSLMLLGSGSRRYLAD